MVARVTTLQPFRQDACHGQRPSTARPWLAAVCTGLVLAAILTTIALVLDDTPSWLLLMRYHLKLWIGVLDESAAYLPA